MHLPWARLDIWVSYTFSPIYHTHTASDLWSPRGAWLVDWLVRVCWPILRTCGPSFCIYTCCVWAGRILFAKCHFFARIIQLICLTCAIFRWILAEPSRPVPFPLNIYSAGKYERTDWWTNGLTDWWTDKLIRVGLGNLRFLQVNMLPLSWY